MPFLPPNQQRQSTEGKVQILYCKTLNSLNGLYKRQWLHYVAKTATTSLRLASSFGCQHDTVCICCKTPCRCWSISPARTALSSKPAARRCCCRSTGQTDGRTDTRPLHRPCSAYYAGSVNIHLYSSSTLLRVQLVVITTNCFYVICAWIFVNTFSVKDSSLFGITRNATLLILAVFNASKCLYYRVTSRRVHL